MHLDDMKLSQPVISPVLDLSRVKKEAPKIGAMMAIAPISPIASTDHAAAIATQQTALTAGPITPETSINFEQNNYSPDPLSNIEIYRQTNNQLSRLKGFVVAVA